LSPYILKGIEGFYFCSGRSIIEITEVNNEPN